jgi:hypothetical protein
VPSVRPTADDRHRIAVAVGIALLAYPGSWLEPRPLRSRRSLCIAAPTQPVFACKRLRLLSPRRDVRTLRAHARSNGWSVACLTDVSTRPPRGGSRTAHPALFVAPWRPALRVVSITMAGDYVDHVTINKTQCSVDVDVSIRTRRPVGPGLAGNEHPAE